MKQIKKAAVIGSGVMGSGIAAHLANIGIPVTLFDMVPKELLENEKKKGFTLEHPEVRNRIPRTAIEKLVTTKPAPLTSKKSLALIEPANLEDDLEKLREADWIIEVVVENLAVKKQVFATVDQYRKPGSIVSSNTSGISVEAMSEGRSDDFRKNFLGTHFFNPPRYLKLLEVIPTKATDTDVVSFMKQFGEDVLGKGVVIAKDTPNFIANRIGTYGLHITLLEMQKRQFSVGEVDSITGPLIGRPKSATFRTLDVVGLDTFVHVANNIYEQVSGEEKQVFEVPAFLKEMVQKGWTGAKAGQGFYLKKGKEILELNPVTFEYEERKSLQSPAVEMAKQQKGTANKLKTLVYGNDRASELLWNILTPVLLYSAELLGEIADTIVEIDRAMKWGFGWELGPFETWDAIGVEKSISIMKQQGKQIPSWVENMLQQGHTSFYKEENGDLFYYDGEGYQTVKTNPKEINLKQWKIKHGVIKKNTGASLIDLGDGVALLEFHSKSNAIGLDIMEMIHYAIDEVEKNYKGLIIGNQGKNFCVGANIALMLMEAQDDNLFELDMVVRKFQQAMMRIKYSRKPVVAAPFNMALGGGAEVSLPADHIQASMETYMGLVEVGVGLIPGGGGTKELYIKHLQGIPNGVEFDLQKVANKVFETIAMAKVSTSAEEARENNFLSPSDGVSVNPDHLIYDAKQAVLAMDAKGYKPRVKRKIPVVGETGYATLLLGAQAMHKSRYISDHDLLIAKRLAYVIAGGKVPFGTEVDEEYLLNLEREAFISLISHPKTQARMQHMLLKGKPLRN
ncbi:MAG TPA: 3-hydroxyacyl-CoA dehydrogenase NAD-binding domain-containing protein [Bacillus sp. (in: firmicutes)]|uniref:3-hydroxyacyl-CoA dehydrogenase/enoyl-CoA hydratase family protein n=1 Tax=Bacillus litorisediminis TaxID=2922713 RepID=UPI001FAD40D0|nr:3-hydroxyacyl-CoA dehydrogenase/enoyl-CoA hydratase family protein [Bacillus litorisediminis]HWO77133.1 3-hydroxyacyl-CoA dehydrogenase NAD-binding domain-containing protein [Bacillus sp. (in: firmicutes)]